MNRDARDENVILEIRGSYGMQPPLGFGSIRDGQALSSPKGRMVDGDFDFL
ncbi:MAG: hypothetical protein M3R52_08115 [Acidobacteriota bacterium]|nr:hypothetical protein [Acidobacteriota bacterium]